MTEKQELILAAALRLFAENGYTATPTSRIAKEAGVSEGLIFRHFESKEGLLNAIIQEGEEQLKKLYADIVMEPDPKKVIRKTIELPFSVSEVDYNFWRLQFKLKWELKNTNPDKMKPLLMALTNAFEQLGYESPKLEAAFLNHYLDGVGTAILQGTLTEKQEMRDFLLHKYQV